MIYHITNEQAWQQALTENSYSGNTLVTEGFIHCSKAAQVEGSLNKHFKGQTGLLLLYINEALLASKLVFENLAGGDNLFPHIYGPLNIDAVERFVKLKPNEDGSHRIQDL